MADAGRGLAAGALLTIQSDETTIHPVFGDVIDDQFHSPPAITSGDPQRLIWSDVTEVQTTGSGSNRKIHGTLPFIHGNERYLDWTDLFEVARAHKRELTAHVRCRLLGDTPPTFVRCSLWLRNR